MSLVDDFIRGRKDNVITFPGCKVLFPSLRGEGGGGSKRGTSAYRVTVAKITDGEKPTWETFRAVML